MAIDTVVEEVASNLEEVAEVTRRINTNSVAFFLGGTAFGFALGFYWGYKFNKEKIKAEAFKESREEVEKIRETYRLKTLAATPKPSVEEMMVEKGYSEAEIKEHVRPTRPPVPVQEPVIAEVEKEEWDWDGELTSRVDGTAYVIHQDEYMGNEKHYEQVAYTYYAIDDVLTDEDDHPVPHGDLIVGVENLKFGHGTDDPDVVFVRNENMEREMEICRIHKSYEQEVLGLSNNETD